MQVRSIIAAVLLLAFATNLSAQAAEEYEKLLSDMRQQQMRVPPRTFMGIAEERLLSFISRYPDSPEAANAHLSLGQLYAQTGKAERAVPHLETYLGRGDKSDPGRVATAKYFLAKSYMVINELDKAEAFLREVAEGSGAVPQRVRDAVSLELGRLPILRKLVIGNPAIPIEAKTSEGKEITLEAYKGTVLLLDFWASWCSPCRQEMPNVKKVYNKFHDKGFEILGISLDESSEKFRSYLEEQDITWPQIFDGKGWGSGVGQSYAVTSIPATFLIDREGRIRYRDLRGEDLYEAVETLLAEE